MEVNSGVSVTVVGVDGSCSEKEIFLMGHCVLCLRRTSKCGGGDTGGLSGQAKRGRMEEQEEVVPEAGFLANWDSGFLWTLNWTWNALRRKRGQGWCGGEKEQVFVGGARANYDLGGVTQFKSIPTMCQDCGNKLLGIERLLNQVVGEIDLIKSTLGRLNNFGDFRYKLYNLVQDRWSLHETLEFLEDFQNKAVATGGDPLTLFEQPTSANTANPEWTEQEAFSAGHGRPIISVVTTVGNPLQSLEQLTSNITIAPNRKWMEGKASSATQGTPIVPVSDKDFNLPLKENCPVVRIDAGYVKTENYDDGEGFSDNVDDFHEPSGGSMEDPLSEETPVPGTSTASPENINSKSLRRSTRTPRKNYTENVNEPDNGFKAEEEESEYSDESSEEEQDFIHKKKSSSSKNEHGQQKVECKFCGKLVNFYYLKKHQKSFHKHAKLGARIPGTDTLLQSLKIQLPESHTSMVQKNENGKSLHLTVTNPATKRDYFICLIEQCRERFEGEDLLEKHYNQEHGRKMRRENANKTKCEQCGKLVRLSYLEQHQKYNCSGTERPKVKCDLCGNSFLAYCFSQHQKVCKGVVLFKDQRRTRCDHCGVEMAKKHVRLHLKRNHPEFYSELTKTCDLCKIVLPRSQLLEHLKEHVGEEYVIKCPNPECTFVCVNLQELVTFHMSKHSRNSRNKCLKWISENQPEFRKLARSCSECGYANDNLLSLRGHLLRHHETPEKNYPCPISGCQQRFSVRQSVVLHLNKHDALRQTNSQPCSGCEKKLVNVEEMEAHLKEEHGVQQVVKCRQCPFQFPSWEELVDHMFEHRYGELPCDICEGGKEKFNRHIDLQRHYFTVHQIGKQYQCEQCPRSFFKLSSVGKHVALDHQQKGNCLLESTPKPVYKCEECDAVRKTEDGLRTHKIREHGAEPYGCKLCTETFVTHKGLCEHEKLKHKGIAKAEVFPCSEPGCGEVFQNCGRLAYHRSAVHSSKKFVCEHCGKEYRTAGDLKRHNEVTHLGIRKWICDTCGESFTENTTLQRHNLIHTGERPFACDICGQRFRQKEVMQTHVKGHLEKGDNFKPNGPMKEIRKRTRPC